MNEKWLTRQTLLRRAQNPDDHDAWEEFIGYYKNFIEMLLRKMGIVDAYIDDITQEILLLLWRDLPNYEYSPDRAKFRSWLSRVIRNTMLDQLDTIRRVKNKHELFAYERWDNVSEGELEKLIDSEWRVYLTNLAMKKIETIFSGKAIQVFLMSFDGKSTEEISEELDITVSSVYKLKGRVKDRLVQEISRLKEELDF